MKKTQSSEPNWVENCGTQSKNHANTFHWSAQILNTQYTRFDTNKRAANAYTDRFSIWNAPW